MMRKYKHVTPHNIPENWWRWEIKKKFTHGNNIDHVNYIYIFAQPLQKIDISKKITAKKKTHS